MGYLVQGKIDDATLVEVVSGSGRGGTVVFLGTVRAGPGDGPVTAIEYSAYDQMAEAEFDRIEGEVKQRWKDVRVAIQHRLGIVSIGEASIVIAAAAPHRNEAFEACRYVIDEAKARVPIWKREFFDDGERRWRSNSATTEES